MEKLSDFMMNLRCSEKKVLVSEKQLRDYVLNTNELYNIAEERARRINKLTARIEALEAALAVQHDTIDLFA